MSFAVIIELATIVAYVVIVCGGVQTRSYGWKVVCSLLAVVSLVQCASMSLVVCTPIENLNNTRLTPHSQAFLYDHNERFFPGWQLDTSWILCTVSWGLAFLTAIGMGTAAYMLPEEGGYELIPGEH
jgi:hypothetical protein